jgi:Fe-S-cluster containining protein
MNDLLCEGQFDKQHLESVVTLTFKPMRECAKVCIKTPLDFHFVYLGKVIQEAKTLESRSAEEKKKKIFRQLGNLLHIYMCCKNSPFYFPQNVIIF